MGVQTFVAISVSVPNEIDRSHGEGWLQFQWKDSLFGQEGLTIDLDGHCSRNMPMRSGNGPPEVFFLKRDCMRLQFTPSLAKKLELQEVVDIYFSINDAEFLELQQAVDLFFGHLPGSPSAVAGLRS
jgi:hypothetical protein